MREDDEGNVGPGEESHFRNVSKTSNGDSRGISPELAAEAMGMDPGRERETAHMETRTG